MFSFHLAVTAPWRGLNRYGGRRFQLGRPAMNRRKRKPRCGYARAGRSISGIHAQPEPGSYARTQPRCQIQILYRLGQSCDQFRSSLERRTVPSHCGEGWVTIRWCHPLLRCCCSCRLPSSQPGVLPYGPLRPWPRACDRQRRSPMSNSEPYLRDVKQLPITR